VEINTKINLLAYVNPAVMAKEPPVDLHISNLIKSPPCNVTVTHDESAVGLGRNVGY